MILSWDLLLTEVGSSTCEVVWLETVIHALAWLVVWCYQARTLGHLLLVWDDATSRTDIAICGYHASLILLSKIMIGELVGRIRNSGITMVITGWPSRRGITTAADKGVRLHLGPTTGVTHHSAIHPCIVLAIILLLIGLLSHILIYKLN